MGDSGFPMFNSDLLYGSIDGVISADFSDNLFSWSEDFPDLTNSGWTFADLDGPSSGLNMFPAEPLPHSFFDLEDYLSVEIVDPGQIFAHVTPPLFDMNIFIANPPPDEPFEILGVLNFPPPPPPPPPGGATIGDGNSASASTSETDTDPPTFEFLGVLNFPPPPPPPPPGGATIGGGNSARTSTSETDTDPPTTPKARQEGTGQGDHDNKDVKDLLKRKREGTPDESDRDTTDITSKKPKYEDMCDILDFRPPGQQRRRLPGRARLTEAERQRVAIVRRAGACEECRRKKKRCTHVNFEQRYIIIFDHAPSLPELCLEILRIKLKGDSVFASSAIAFNIQARVLFKRQMGTGLTRVLMQISKENYGRGLSVEAQGGAEGGTVNGEQHTMAVGLDEDFLHSISSIFGMRRLRDDEIAGWLDLLSWRRIASLTAIILCRPALVYERITKTSLRMLAVVRRLTSGSRVSKYVVGRLIVRRALATVVNSGPPIVHEQAIRLRQYQEDCIQSVLSYLEKGHKRLGVSLATGSGKTVIFTQLIDRVPSSKNASQTLILVHRRELVQQAAQHCERAYPTKSIEIEMGETHASGFADITVASVRSMDSGDRISKYVPNRFKLVLVDEAHHIVAPGYMRTLEHFGLDSPRQTGPALVGVSATFSRFDGLRLGAAIDHIVYHKDYVDMIGEKWLSDVMFTTVKSKANLSRVKSGRDGDFQVGQLSRAVNNDETNEITVKAWLAEAGNRKSTLVFCVDLKHVSSLTSMFRKYGIDAQYITGATRKSVRGDRLQAFKDRKFPVLLNCGVFTEGTDIPNIDCILLARPTKSRNLLVQMIGRGMRLHAGKENCHVIDMVASLETGIVTVPTLFGLDPSEIVKEASPNALRELKDRKLEEKNTLVREAKDTMLASNATELAESSLTFTHYDSVHDLIEDTSGERHIRAISQNAWVQVDDAKFILAARGGVLTLQKTEPDKFTVLHKYALSPTEKSKAPWSRPREVASAATLSDAIHAADTFAATKFERIYINNSSDWRKQPASENQLAFLNKMRFDEEPLRSDQVTKGRAGDMITKIKFGARGRFDKIMVKKRQSEREIAKIENVENMRRREVVQVGPLER